MKIKSFTILLTITALALAGCSSAPEMKKGTEEIIKPGDMEIESEKVTVSTQEIQVTAGPDESRRIREGEKNCLEDSKTFFNYDEYEKAIENALLAYKYSENPAEKEEALYLVNESAEEIVTEVKRDLYIKPMTNIISRLDDLKDKYGVTIKMDKIGYQHLIYYDKAYYHKLKKLNPASEFIKKIELKHMARLGQFATNPAYRFKEIINITKKYMKIVEENPDISYAPDILIRIGDLYLYMYEEGDIVKKELRLTQKDLDYYYREAVRIYKEVKKKYPKSAAAQSIVYVIDNVRLRQDPHTKSRVVKRIQAGTLVKILDMSAKKEQISNMRNYWYKVKLTSGLEGWIFGFYLRANY